MWHLMLTIYAFVVILSYWYLILCYSFDFQFLDSRLSMQRSAIVDATKIPHTTTALYVRYHQYYEWYLIQFYLYYFV